MRPFHFHSKPAGVFPGKQGKTGSTGKAYHQKEETASFHKTSFVLLIVWQSFTKRQYSRLFIRRFFEETDPLIAKIQKGCKNSHDSGIIIR
jgi:hypothetical protein